MTAAPRTQARQSSAWRHCVHAGQCILGDTDANVICWLTRGGYRVGNSDAYRRHALRSLGRSLHMGLELA